ncbi:hypothetical protein BDP27DRAFT_1451820 [Rhodocollybia butyracea]|uniref:G-protein coupled receptors family 1 profile domain-containing protein n=1 Tax=Rhodocollybia butyracea TaxID=206335 RepID=A0A9P5U262_9AGAR|nr:hypothetical protein BDP27DRAFT_1451820 [Rhodocollybia butyracea]
MGSWVVFCMSYLLLFFSGHAFDGEPELSLCIIQSSLTYAVSPFAAACALALVTQLFFNINSALTGNSIGGSRYWRVILIAAPYAVFFFLVLESTIIALAAPNAEFSSISYCSLQSNVPSRITSALDVVLVLPVLVLNVLIYLRFRKHRAVLRTGNLKSMFIRVSAFMVFGIIAVAVGSLFFVIAFLNAEGSNTGLVELDIILSTLPIAAVIVFGTHKDLLVVWLFWRKKHNYSGFPAVLRETKPKTTPHSWSPH